MGMCIFLNNRTNSIAPLQWLGCLVCIFIVTIKHT